MRITSFAALVILTLVTSAAAETPEVDPRQAAQRRLRAGEELLQANAADKAAEEFRAAIALDPLLTLAHYNLGQSLMAQKRYPEAEAAYLACVAALEGRNQMTEAERTQALKDIDDQIRNLRDLVRQIPLHAKGGVDTTLRALPFEQRIRVLEQSKPTESAAVTIPAELRLALGSAYLRQNKLADAEREYTAALASDKKLGAAHNNLAVIYMLTGRFTEARGAIKAAEKAGFPVSPALKDDIDKREAAAKAPPAAK